MNTSSAERAGMIVEFGRFARAEQQRVRALLATIEEQEAVRDLAKRHGLVVTGGSDHHGDMVPDRKLPGGKNGVMVPDEVLDNLKDVVSALRSW